MTMCAPVVQGYGLTETCAGSFISVPDLHVGAPSHLPVASQPWKALPASPPPQQAVCAREGLMRHAECAGNGWDGRAAPAMHSIPVGGCARDEL